MSKHRTSRPLSGGILRRLRGSDAGLSMAEIIVALMVFAVIATCVAYGLTNSLQLTQNSRSRAAAMNLAAQDADALRLTALSTTKGLFSVNSTSTPIVTTVGGVAYSLTRTVQWVTTTGATGACGTGAGTLAYKSVVQKVSWRNSNSAQPQSVTSVTSIAPSGKLNNDTTGTVIVQVTGGNAGSPRAGVKISITPNSGGGGQTLTESPSNTDADGCSFGLKVTPGTYTVTATLSDGIDITQKTPATNTNVVVKAGQNSLVSFGYDSAATFPLVYPVGSVTATNMVTTMYNPVGGSSAFSNSPTSVTAFPWSDGYRPIAGNFVLAAGGGTATCLNSDPNSWKTPAALDGAVAQPNSAVAATPGSTALPTAVPMGQMALTGLGTNVFVTAVSVSTGPDGDPGCASTQTLTFPKTSLAQTISLPYGTWKLYSGSSAGAKTKDLVATGSLLTVIPVTRGSVNGALAGAYANSVTMDPRVVVVL